MLVLALCARARVITDEDQSAARALNMASAPAALTALDMLLIALYFVMVAAVGAAARG